MQVRKNKGLFTDPIPAVAQWIGFCLAVRDSILAAEKEGDCWLDIFA